MKCLTISWLRPLNKSASVSLPFGPSNTYCFSTLTQGRSRRSLLNRSRSRVNSFSLASNSLRAESHSSRDTIRCCIIASPSCVRDVVGKALESAGPTALMRIARQDRLKDALVQSELCLAADIGEGHGDQCLVARIAVGVFRGISEDKPLRLDDLAIDPALAVLAPVGRAHQAEPSGARPDVHIAGQCG